MVTAGILPQPDLTGISGVNKTTDLRQRDWPLVPNVNSSWVILSDLFRRAGKFSGEGDSPEFLADSTPNSLQVGAPAGEDDPATAPTPQLGTYCWLYCDSVFISEKYNTASQCMSL